SSARPHRSRPRTRGARPACRRIPPGRSVSCAYTRPTRWQAPPPPQGGHLWLWCGTASRRRTDWQSFPDGPDGFATLSILALDVELKLVRRPGLDHPLLLTLRAPLRRDVFHQRRVVIGNGTGALALLGFKLLLVALDLDFGIW